MRLHILSDLHLDHWRGPIFRPECEDEANTVLVLAGDIIGLLPKNHKMAVDFFSDVVKRYREVVVIAGNHEYYGTSWEGAHTERTYIELKVLAGTGKPFLLTEEWDLKHIDGQRFLCGTMWVPEPAPGTPNITDASQIKRYKPRVFQNHKIFCEGLDAFLTETDIVVSHHLPSNQSVAAQYYGDIYNAWFVAPDVENKIREREPKIFIHGHTHVPADYFIGRTRIICNPRGYEREGIISDNGLVFNPHLVIEI